MAISQKELFSYLSYDKISGVFLWNKKTGTGNKGAEAGSIHRFGYRIICIKKQRYRAHRLAWFYVYGTWPENDIDHIDGNKLNNSIENLRDVSRLINEQNQIRPQNGNSSGLLGVSWNRDRKKWVAQIRVNKQLIYLGRYHDKHAAHAVYIEAKRRLQPGCTI